MLFYLIFPLVLVSCVPAETEPDSTTINEDLADIVTVVPRDENILATASPIVTSTTIPIPTSTSTAIPPELIQPTPVPTLTPTTISTVAIQTLSPNPTETPATLLSPTPFQTPENALTCHAGQEFTKCYDVVLGLEFEYPTEWGTLTGYLRQAKEQRDDSEEWFVTGYAYEYRFDQTYIVEAGGRSREFSESRGGMLTDFSGFLHPDIICRWPHNRPNEICNEVKPNVFFVISLTNATEFCKEEYGRGIEAFAAVALEIPDNDLINGFIFGTNILGADIIEEITHDFPQREQPEIVCDDATRQAFDQRMEQIAEDIANMTVTGETLYNLELLNHLAESIIFK